MLLRDSNPWSKGKNPFGGWKAGISLFIACVTVEECITIPYGEVNCLSISFCTNSPKSMTSTCIYIFVTFQALLGYYLTYYYLLLWTLQSGLKTLS